MARSGRIAGTTPALHSSPATLGISSVTPSTSLDHNGDGWPDLDVLYPGLPVIHGAAQYQHRERQSELLECLYYRDAHCAAIRSMAVGNVQRQGLDRADVDGDGRQDLKPHRLCRARGRRNLTTISLVRASGFDLTAEAIAPAQRQYRPSGQTSMVTVVRIGRSP